MCKDSGLAKDNHFQRSKGGVFTSVSELNICPICSESLYKFNVTLLENIVKEVVEKRLLYCYQFYTADTRKKRDMFRNVMASYAKLGKIFISWHHDFS